MKRLSKRMKALGMVDAEIPKERGYRAFWERLKRQINTPTEARGDQQRRGHRAYIAG
jgi:hypothetical protein